MARELRKTFQIAQWGINRRLINIETCGTSWHEVLEACLGFLDDEDISSGHFSSEDLELLIKIANKRLHQTNIGAGLPCNCDICKKSRDGVDMSEERMERVYLKDGSVMIASYNRSIITPQRIGNPINSQLLIEQINAMLAEAEERGVTQGYEDGYSAGRRLGPMKEPE